MSRQRWIPSAALALAVGLLATMLTSQVQREGPEQAIYNHECGTPQAPCFEARTAAGLPLQYWFDTPGVSVEHQLSLGEDGIRWRPFVLDVAAFALLFAAAVRLPRLVKRSRKLNRW